MKLEAEGVSYRAGLFERHFVAFDEVREVQARRLLLHGGREVRVPGPVAAEVQAVLTAPRPGASVASAAEGFLAWVARPRWAPELAARTLLELAGALGASDLHLESGPAEVLLRLRLAGEMVPFGALPPALGGRLVAAFKRLAGCLPYRRDVVQEGRVSRAGVAADVRASFLPTALGERAALRLFGRLLTLDEVGLPLAARQGLERALAARHGLVLVAGPSGGGKTTTLYAALHALTCARGGAHLSLEDPVEQRLRVAGIPVDQVELAPERGLTGEAALVAALRQDIDVLCVGELRTPAEASLAVKAAHTGRLVLAGLHAGSAMEARQRLVDLGLDAAQVDATVTAVLHQRLVARPCADHQGSACSACRGVGRTRHVEAQWWTPVPDQGVEA